MSDADEEWITCSPFEGVPSNTFTIKDLQANEQYRLRVSAGNEAGFGEAEEFKEAVEPKDIIIHPKLEVDQTVGQFVTIKSGETINLSVSYSGRPLPSIKWKKEDGLVRESAQIEISDSSTSLTIENATQQDTGKYDENTNQSHA